MSKDKSLQLIGNNILENMKGLGLIILILFSIISVLSVTFSSFYVPARLSFSGEMKEMTLIDKKLEPKISRFGAYGLTYKAKMEGQDKFFSIVPDIYDELIEGNTYPVFYSSDVRFGILSGKPLTLYSSLRDDSIHSAYITFPFFVFFTLFLFYKGSAKAIQEFIVVYFNYSNKFDHETDPFIRHSNIWGAIVPYGVVVAFIYIICAYCIRSVFLIEGFDDYWTGIVVSVAITVTVFSPYLLLRLRFILTNARFTRIFTALMKIGLSLLATGRLIIFIHESDLTSYQNINKLMFDVFKFVFAI